MGVFDDINCKETSIKLNRGDRIFLYTDGIPETANAEKEIVGFEDKLLGLFSKANRLSLDETIDAVMEEISMFRGDAPVEDDLAIIGIEVL